MMNEIRVTRKSFLKMGVCLTASAAIRGYALDRIIDQKGAVVLVSEPQDSISSAVPSKWALSELKQALQNQSVHVRVASSLVEVKADEFCIVATGMSNPLAKQMMSGQRVAPPTKAESLCLLQGTVEEKPVLLAAGYDELGLVYALTELADRVNCYETGLKSLTFNEPVVEQPESRIRSVMRHFCSELEDKPWFYDEDYWRAYLDMLVYSRLNRMSFSTGMAYNSASRITDGYLLFPFPFFVEVPRYQVRANGLSAEERARNLEMLRFIGTETTKRGLKFQFGIWTLAYQWRSSPDATYRIEGLTDNSHPSYCRDALALLLKEVPTISGVTFRVHSESGIPKGSENFWRTQFSAVASCGRRCEIDMHAKNMEPETLKEALATGQPVVVSPKYCGEHLGLPYHQASIRDHEMVPADKFTDTGEGVLIGDRHFTRYGYADFLSENRTWDVVFRIWPGTQRFLLNGDPALFAGYGRSAAFCGAAGIDLCEPLAFKGRRGSGRPGGRCAYADESLNPRYDFEKYRYTYRLWGRLGYNPETDPEVWRRALRQEFGGAAPGVEKALASASRVLPLFTLAHDPSADCVRYWPEIYTNIPIADKTRKLVVNYDMSKPALFGHVSPLDPQLFMSGDETGDALINNRVSGKYTSIDVATWFESIARSIDAGLEDARQKGGVVTTRPAFRRVQEDALIHRGLALLFAAKLRISVLWRIFELTADRAAGETAIARYEAARAMWAEMAVRAASIYRSDISYCSGEQSRGHWMDRIPECDADIADLKKRLAQGKSAEEAIHPDVIERAIEQATGSSERPKLSMRHNPGNTFSSGKPLPVSLQCEQAKRVTLHYREVNQARRWQSLELTKKGDVFDGVVPGDYTATRFPLQYYFEVETVTREATMIPALHENLSNVAYFVVRRG